MNALGPVGGASGVLKRGGIERWLVVEYMLLAGAKVVQALGGELVESSGEVAINLLLGVVEGGLRIGTNSGGTLTEHVDVAG